MTLLVEKADAAELTRIAKEIQAVEFSLAKLNEARRELINKHLAANNIIATETTKISAPPDWSELLVSQ